MNDLRSPLAKSRDEWLESDEGKRCASCIGISIDPSKRQYLRNRLATAFLAGAAAGALISVDARCNK